MVLDLQIRIARVLIKIGEESEGIKTRDSRDLGGIARNYRASSWTEEEDDRLVLLLFDVVSILTLCFCSFCRSHTWPTWQPLLRIPVCDIPHRLK